MDAVIKLVTMLEVKYIKSHGYRVGDLEVQGKIFPSEWYRSDHYVLKSEILSDAIKNNKLITETEKYQELLELVSLK